MGMRLVWPCRSRMLASNNDNVRNEWYGDERVDGSFVLCVVHAHVERVLVAGKVSACVCASV